MPLEAERSTRDVSKRSSIRQSLNFMTVGKALVDVMNTDKEGTKSKRSSTVSSKPSSARPSLGDVPSIKRASSPGSSATHRRRMSAIATRTRNSIDELGMKESKESGESVATITRASTLRARPGGSGSALPKYRPKPSKLNPEPKSSPHKSGTRRSHESSNDEREPTKPVGPGDKEQSSPVTRPGTRKPRTTNTRSSTDSSTPEPRPQIPSQATRIQKSSSTSSGGTSGARPSSTTSFNSTPPTTPSRKRIAAQPASKPPKGSPLSASDSPSAQRSRKPVKSPDTAGNDSISGDAEEVEKADVALLLAPTSSLAEPTPALPRISRPPQDRSRTPQTPTRGAKRKTQATKAPVIVPMPQDESPRPRLQASTSNAPRGSILSWEEMAQEASRTLGEDEIGAMLADVDAPFRSRAGSPSLSCVSVDMPESPALSQFNSPAAFHSISAVLLPDHTPSPAPHTRQQQQSPDAFLSGDSTNVTLLRLQMASVERTASDRLHRIQGLEKEISDLKKQQLRETEKLTSQVGELERQILGKLQASQRDDESQMARIVALEKQLKLADRNHDEAVSLALDSARRQYQSSHTAAMAAVCGSWRRLHCSQIVVSAWNSAEAACRSELDALRSDRQILDVLVPELEFLRDCLAAERS